MQFRAKSLKDCKPKAINLLEADLVRTGFLGKDESLPLVIEPAWIPVDLANWADGNLSFIRSSLSEYGAILLRGFEVYTDAAFEQVAKVLCPNLHTENGEHPRKRVSGNVYTPVFYPPDRKLLWHNENSFNHSWPAYIMFCCIQPASEGGETPIVDSRKVFEALSPQIKAPFLQKGIMYVRNYGDGFGLDWQTVFQTSSRSEVEEYCKQRHFSFEWKSGNRLRTRCVRPAIVKHPTTGESTWFNQAQHWHPSCLDPQTRASFLSSFQEEDLPRNCYYGDGLRIEDQVMGDILDVYAGLEVSFPWRKGDVLMLDNSLTAHGRNPFVGDRRILVAMGEMSTY